ncbi:MAG TPA: hypothetical protein VEM35_09490 [Rhizomicrobium sp.]|nr:hypothetical protein [Rhizomicrobium sp.]
MRSTFALAALLVVFAVPALAQPTVMCGYGQNCPNGRPSVPFPVISPVQGLSNILTYPIRRNQPPPPPPMWYYAPIATPPPILPPNQQR